MKLTRERRQQVISGILIIAALLLTIAALLKEIDAVHRPAILIDFYAVERNESGEYRFTRPTSHILVPPRSSDAVVLSFRTYSPHPLLERTLTLRLDQTLLILLAMRCGILAGTCGSAIVAGMGLWGWMPAWIATIAIGATRVFDRLFDRGYGALWRRQIDSALHRLSFSDLVIGLLTIAWISVVGWGSLALHHRYATGAYDLGLFDQWLWLISRGLPPYSTGIGVHILGDHTAVLLYPLAALYLIASDVQVLLIVQSLAVGVGGLALYRMGCVRGSPWMGALIAGAYLLHPSTHNMALFHFPPDALAATALLVALWGIERRNAAMISVAAIAVCTAKENFAITTAWLGAWLFVRGERRWGGTLILGSIAWFILAAFLIQPAFNGQSQSVFTARFARYGASPGDVILTILQRPDILVLDLCQPENLRYLSLVLAPLGMLPLLSPARAVLTLPALALNMLSNFDAQRSLLFHYDALTVALLSYAGLGAAIALERWLKAPRAALVACAICITLGASWTAMVVPLRLQDAIFPSARDVEWSYVRRYALAHIPHDSAVSASQALQPHLTHRRQAFVFPNPFVRVNYVHPAGSPQPPSVEFIIYDTSSIGGAITSREQELLRELEQGGLFTPVIRVDAITLMRRTDASLPNFCFGADWQNAVCRCK